MIWHDKGEDGLRMIEQMAELYKKDHPGVTVKSLSMPTEQWFSRSIAALNTNTAPDILFNDNAQDRPDPAEHRQAVGSQAAGRSDPGRRQGVHHAG